MKVCTISIDTLKDVYDFINHASKVEGDVILAKGRYTVDAKSLLGVFSINVSENTIVSYPEEAIEFDNYIKRFEKQV